MASFAFLHGEWTVSHDRQGKTFEGTARFVSLADGTAVIEELFGPDGKALGVGVRTFDRARGVWADRWMPARSGVLGDPVEGKWIDGVASFQSLEDGMHVRGVWKRISNDEVTWEQATSTDGKSWKMDWKMRFKRRTATAR